MYWINTVSCYVDILSTSIAWKIVASYLNNKRCSSISNMYQQTVALAMKSDDQLYGLDLLQLSLIK